MDQERFERVQELFHAAADLTEPARTKFLAGACAGDEALRADVLSLLEEDARGTPLLDGGGARVAKQLTGNMTEALMKLEFGPYHLRHLIGEGGMGVVYAAVRDDLGSAAAVKILRDAGLSPARRERFQTEQRILAQLVHPCIARLYDADTLADGTPWFAMEYVQGVPITEYCAQRNCSVEQRLLLMRSVCETVHFAHLRTVIHRDLKPSNILVTESGEVKLLDFGIAKQLDGATLPETQTVLRMMTPAYAAPEEMRGEMAGVYTDVYSLGVLLYELLSGKLPSDTTAAVDQEPERPSRVPGAIRAGRASWADLDVLCLKAMHPEPQRRYSSVEALIRDIDHFLAGEPLEAQPDSRRYRAAKFVARHRRAVLAASLALAAILGLSTYYTLGLRAARNEALLEAARAERIQRFTMNLFQGGDKETGPSEDLRVTDLLDRGVQEARLLDREPAVQAELFQTLGDIFQKLGRFDRAETLLGEALQRRKALPGRDGDLAESLVSMGLLRTDQARLKEAESSVREGLDLARRTLRADDPRIAAATDALGRVLEEQGKYDPAIAALDEAVRMRANESPADLAASLSELANAHFYAGHYKESEALNQRVLAMHREIYGNRHPLVADDLINLGAIQQDTGHYVDAEKFHREALTITEAFFGKDHYRTASNLTLIARALVSQNRFDEAVQLLNRALAVQERVFGKVHPRVASALNELGNTAIMRGHYPEAEADFQRIVEIYRSVYNGKHYLIGIALSNLASSLMAHQENATAEKYFREALAMYAQTLEPDHMNAAIGHIKLGRTLLRQKRYAEAEVETRRGYEVLKKQADPSISFLVAARKDLAAIYEGLHRPEEAKVFIAEQAALETRNNQK